MASYSPVFACMFLGFVLFSASELMHKNMLPPWLLAPLMRLRAVAQAPSIKDDDSEAETPAGVMMQQLKGLDPAKQPESAHALHAAIAKLLRKEGGPQRKDALKHFEAARDAAANSEDPDVLINAQLELAEAYIEEGRAMDSQRVITKATGVLPNHFVEHRPKLNRGRGRAKFEMGYTEQALDFFIEAEKQALETEDKVRIACDIAAAHTCLGKASDSVTKLRQTLEMLQASQKARSDGGMPQTLYNMLAGDIHFNLAEAFHSMKDNVFARAHYMKAMNLLKKSETANPKRAATINKALAKLEKGRAPDLHCPQRPRSPVDKARDPKQDMQAFEFMDKINELLEEQQYDKAISQLRDELRKRERPYHGTEAASALLVLGNIYLKQGDATKAAAQFRQSLHAAIVTEPCCDAGSKEAAAAYEALRDVKPQLAAHDQRVASAAISRYFDIVEQFSKSHSDISNEADKRTDEVVTV